MSFYEFDGDSVKVIHACGHDVSVKVKDLVAGPDHVRTPWCSECKKSFTMIKCIERGEGDNPTEANQKRDILFHSVHKAVVKAGKFEDGVTKKDIPDGVNSKAVDGPVSAPIHKRFEELREEKGKK